MPFSSAGSYDGMEAGSSMPLSSRSGSGSGDINSGTTSPSPAPSGSATVGLGLGLAIPTTGAGAGAGAGLPWPLQTQLDSFHRSPEIVPQPYPNHHAQQYTSQPAYGVTNATPITPLNTQPFAKPWSMTPDGSLQPHRLHTPLGQTPSQGPLDRHSSLTPLVAAWTNDPSPVTATPNRLQGSGSFITSGYAPGPTTPRKRLSISAVPSPHNQYSPYAFPASANAASTLPNGRPARPSVSLPPMPSGHLSGMSPPSGLARNGMVMNGPPSYISPVHPLSYGMRMHPAPNGFEWEGFPEGKPSRFKPTKAQLALLVESYNRNQTPDGDERERLRGLLGPDIKAKTIQIWFQNRRSKSRTKERQAAARRAEEAVGDDDSASGGDGKSDAQSEGSGAAALEVRRKGMQHDGLKALIRDTGNAVAIQVLAVGAWTRFLTPGHGMVDLAMSYSPTQSSSGTGGAQGAHIAFYVKHETESYRIAIPLDMISTTMQITAAGALGSNTTQLDAEASTRRAMTFALPPNIAAFALWKDLGGWTAIDDFTGGAVKIGGRVEVTGGQELSDAYDAIKRSRCPGALFTRTNLDDFHSQSGHSAHTSISSIASHLSGSFSAIEPIVANPFTRPSLMPGHSEPVDMFPTLQLPIDTSPPLTAQPSQTRDPNHFPVVATPRAAGGLYPFLLPSAMADDSAPVGISSDGATHRSGSSLDPFSLTLPSFSMSPDEMAMPPLERGGPIVHSSPAAWPVALPGVNAASDSRANSIANASVPMSMFSAQTVSPAPGAQNAGLESQPMSRASSQDDFARSFDMANNWSYMETEWLEASS